MRFRQLDSEVPVKALTSWLEAVVGPEATNSPISPDSAPLNPLNSVRYGIDRTFVLREGCCEFPANGSACTVLVWKAYPPKL